MGGIFLSLLKHYGDPAVFIGLAFSYIGIPVPAEAMMAFLGFAGIRGTAFSLLLSLVFSAAGDFTGSMFAWFIGYKFGKEVVLKLGRPFRITEDKLDRLKDYFDRKRTVLIIFSRYVPGMRHIVPYISGISRITPKKFLPLSLAGSILWCGTFIGTGFLLGDKWRTVVSLAKTYSLIILLLIIFIFLTVRYFKNHRRMIFATALPLLIFIKLSEDIINRELSVFDSNIFLMVKNLSSRDMSGLMRTLAYMGSGPVLTIVTAVFTILCLVKRRYAYLGWMAAVNLAIGTVFTTAFRMYFHRVNPDLLMLMDITGFGYPAAHSFVWMSCYGYLAWAIWSNWESRWRYAAAAGLFLLIFIIGIGRIYLGAHQASVVLGGFSAGLAWLAVFITIGKRIRAAYNEKLSAVRTKA